MKMMPTLRQLLASTMQAATHRQILTCLTGASLTQGCGRQLQILSMH